MSDPSLPPESERSSPAPVAPMPWEDRARSAFGRFWGTLGNAFAPVRGVPALCSPAVLPAWTFALISAVPFMLAWGVIPFTSTLAFGPSLEVTPTVEAGKIPLWLDLTKSMGISFGVSLLAQLSWALPFMSLLRAFADVRVPADLVRSIAMRFVLYRAWLVPCGTVAFHLAWWALPAAAVVGDGSDPQAQASGAELLAVMLFRFAPHILVLLGAQATAASLGASVLGALAVAVVPAILQEVVGLTVSHYAAQLLPHITPPPGLASPR
jgi:hypothetical protein